jgi:hypothetical protein
MSIRYAKPTNVCTVCGIRLRGLPCVVCVIEEKVEDNMIKKIWQKIKSWICFWK